jgi:hypothetical protein
MGLEDQHALHGAPMFVPQGGWMQPEIVGAVLTPFRAGSIGGYTEGDAAGTIRAAGGDLGGGSENLAVAVTVSNGEPRVSDCMGTLDAARESRGSNQQRFVMQPVPFRKSKRAQSTTDDESWVEAEQANTLNAFDTGERDTHAVAYPIDTQNMTEGHSSGGLGFGQDGDPSFTVTKGHSHAVAFAQNVREEVRLLGGDGSVAGACSAEGGTHQTTYIAQVPMATIDMQACKGNANIGDGSVSPTLCKPSGNDVHAVAFKPGQSAAARSIGAQEEVACTLEGGGGGNNRQAVAIGTDMYNHAITGDVAATMGTPGSSVNGWGPTVMQAVGFNWQNAGGYGNANEGLGITVEGTGPLQRCQTPAVAHALRGEGFDASEDGTGRGTPIIPVAPSLTASNDPSRSPQSAEVTQQVAAVHAATMTVRRLTPRECERLQAFPDDYTLIPWRKKPADQCPDGPRYKALGNSMAVNCMEWIGERIAAYEAKERKP